MTSTDDISARLVELYHQGATTIYASRFDARFSYTLYVPRQLEPRTASILVAVHGTGRMQSLYRDLFAEFAEHHNCIVLAPLFPANVFQDGNLSGYKYLLECNVRYDLVLIDMVREVAEKYGVDGERMLLFGFSGGGHFTHRFAILHPRRLRAASIGAPGAVTLLDIARPWWVGVADIEERFGVRFAPEAFRGLPLHFVVGESDTEVWEITSRPGDRNYMEGANDAGRTRPERIRSLAESFRDVGASVRIDLVPGAAHDVGSVVHCTRAFFHDVLVGRRASGTEPRRC